MRISRRQWMTSATGTLAIGAMSCCCGCSSTPVTNRNQLMLMTEPQEIQLGIQAYEEVLSDEKKSQNQQLTSLIQRVGQRVAAAADRSDFNWEFTLLESPTQNAFALPGGKVAIYEGILPVCGTEAGLAVVMSHEVAHAMARHGSERMSQTMAVDSVKQVAGQILKNEVPERHERLMAAYGIATKYGVLLPYNRKQEAEADHIGIMVMAKAGYDPQEAPKFWRRFGSNTDSQTPEFMSTHPSDHRRASNLAKLMPEAQEIYADATQKFGTGSTIPTV